MASLTIAARYVEAWPPGHFVWRGIVYLDGREIHASMHDCQLDAMRAATKARDAFEAGGYDGMVRQAMFLDIRTQREMFGEPVYSAKGEWSPDDAVRDVQPDWDGGREGELSWS